jgi:hypothetical protein
MKRNLLSSALARIALVASAAAVVGASITNCSVDATESGPGAPAPEEAARPAAAVASRTDGLTLLAGEFDPVARGHEHPSHVDWVSVGNLEEMTRESDLVARGRVVAVRRAARRLLPWNEKEQRYLTPEEAGDVFDEIPLTVSTIELDQVVRAKDGAVAIDGRDVADKSTIEIVELGGRLPDGCVSSPEDKPLLRLEEEAVFFLSAVGGKRVGAYHVVGGWQGRMDVEQGAIHPLARDVHPSVRELVQYDGRGVDDFIADVRAIQIK